MVLIAGCLSAQGKRLTLTDMDDTQQQSFYAIRDGSRSQVYGSGTGQTSLPASVTFPATRSTLVGNSNLLTGRVSDSTKPMGWYYDLHSSEKITTPLVANEGLISWNGYIPTTDACAPGATSNLYVTEYESGKSRLLSSSTLISFYTSPSYLVASICKRQRGQDSCGNHQRRCEYGKPDYKT